MLKPFYKTSLEAGIDEAGRGCLAGPVTAAAVILPENFKLPLLNDSKKLTKKQRNYLRPIIEKKALAYAVTHISPETIDKINILNATFLAMHTAIDKLTPPPKLLIIDGNRFHPYKKITHHCIVKGDGKYLHIAAASVLAKTYRDELMQDYHKEYSNYNWHKNKGYPTIFHKSAIEKFGITPHHRKSFRLLRTQLDFDL